MDSAVKSFLVEFRASANGFLSKYEPLALVFGPLFVILLARLLQSFLDLVYERGLKATFISFFMATIKYEFLC